MVFDETAIPQAGALVRALSVFLPGVRKISEQIPTYATAWRTVAASVWAADENRPVFVALGDSLAQGIGASRHDAGYVGNLGRLLEAAGRPHGVLNLSRSGARIADVVEHQLPLLDRIEHDISIVTCTVGSNDLLRSLRVDRAVRDLRTLIERLPTGAVLAALPAGGSASARAINRTMRNEAERGGVRVADVNAHIGTWRGKSSSDGFHPNDAGYQAWTAAFADVLDLAVEPACEEGVMPPDAAG